MIRALGATLALALSWSAGAFAQVAQARPNHVEGRVLIGGPEERPVPGVWVALNRVASDGAGVLDSVRTGVDGSYRFTFNRTGDPDALYFTDVTYGGVAYFTDPLRSARVVGDAADLVVFDTTSANGSLSVRGRHLVVGAEADDRRRPIVEVFEITNDTTFTIVPGGSDRPVWSLALPDGTEDFEVSEGDLGPNVVRFSDGRAELYAPLSPGLRQLSFRYTLPGRAFPLELTMPQAVDVLEVLLAQEDAVATGAGLHREGEANLEGQQYQRFMAQGVRAGSRVRIAARGSGQLSLEWLVPGAVLFTIASLGAGLAYAKRTAPTSLVAPSPGPT